MIMLFQQLMDETRGKSLVQCGRGGRRYAVKRRRCGLIQSEKSRSSLAWRVEPLLKKTLPMCMFARVSLPFVRENEQVAVCTFCSPVWRSSSSNWRRKRRSCFGGNDFLSPFSGNAACHSMSCWTEDHKRFMHF